MVMFRQIAPHGVVNKTAMTSKIPSEAMDSVRDGASLHEQGNDLRLQGKNITESEVGPQSGEAVATGSKREETKLVHEEMSKITPAECPFLMNKE